MNSAGSFFGGLVTAKGTVLITARAAMSIAPPTA
jgi:hypothetical protein